MIRDNTPTYASELQQNNLAWYLPRPKPDHYKGGMPLHAEDWLLNLARDILKNKDAKIMNLFCGMNKRGFRVDIKPEVKPDLVCDAHCVSEFVKDSFKIILADPPYSDEEAEQLYGTPKLNYSKWTSECTKLLEHNGLLIIYHKLIMPNPDPNIYRIAKRVFIGSRIYHTPRVALFFRKVSQ